MSLAQNWKVVILFVVVLPKGSGFSDLYIHLGTTMQFDRKRGESSQSEFFFWAMVFEWGALLTAVGISLWLQQQYFLLPFAVHWMAILYGVIGSIPCLLLLYFLLSTTGWKWKPLQNIYEILDDFLPTLREMSTWQLIVLGLSAGIGEESLFRGVLQPMLTWMMPVSVSIVVTSLVFGLLHAVTPTYFILATMISIYLGWMAVVCDNLLVPILIHGIYDAIAFYWVKQSHQK